MGRPERRDHEACRRPPLSTLRRLSRCHGRVRLPNDSNGRWVIRGGSQDGHGRTISRPGMTVAMERLYDAIESGVADLNDPALKDRIDGLKATRDQARADAECASALLVSSAQQAITPTMLRKFASRSEEHTSELQSLMRISYAVFCLKK